MPPGASRSWLGRTSRQLGGVSGPIRGCRGLSRLSRGLPLAERLSLPGLWRPRQLPLGHARPAAVPGVSAPDLGDSRHRPGPHPAAVAALVRRGLPGHHPHAGLLGVAAAAPARARALRDGVDDAAQAAPRHGAARARPAFRHGGAGRDLCRWSGGRAARWPAARQQEGDPGRCRGGPRPRLRPDPACGRARPLGRHLRPLRRGSDHAG